MCHNFHRTLEVLQFLGNYIPISRNNRNLYKDTMEETIKHTDRNLKIGLVLNTAFTIFEFTVGFMIGSLALMSDAGNNLTDSLSLVISFTARKLVSRKATSYHTFGYQRASILAALINASILITLGINIFYQAYKRIQHPEPIEGGIVMAVAFIGIIINGSIALLFLKNRSDMNLRSAFLNMAFDALASVGALLGGLLIVLTGKTIFDPIIAIVIGIMLIWSAWDVLKDALHIILEGVPEGVDAKKIKLAITKLPFVKSVDDLHIWALSSEYTALSCHVQFHKVSLDESIKQVGEIKDMLKKKFNIEHATIEPQLTSGPHHNELMDEGM